MGSNERPRSKNAESPEKVFFDMSKIGHLKEELTATIFKIFDSRWEFEPLLKRISGSGNEIISTPDHCLSKIAYLKNPDGSVVIAKVIIILDSKTNPNEKTRNEIYNKYEVFIRIIDEKSKKEGEKYDLVVPILGITSLMPAFAENQFSVDKNNNIITVHYQTSELISEIINNPNSQLAQLFQEEGLDTLTKLKIAQKCIDLKSILTSLELIYEKYINNDCKLEETDKVKSNKIIIRIKCNLGLWNDKKFGFSTEYFRSDEFEKNLELIKSYMAELLEVFNLASEINSRTELEKGNLV